MPPGRLLPLQFPAFIGLLFLFSGCLPSACQRIESHALFPADSLSRRIAEQTPIDTLTFAWESTGASDNAMLYPRTVRFGRDGRVFVSDAQTNQIFEYLNTGILHRIHASPDFSFPFLAGVRGDTLLVFNSENQRVDFTINGRSVTRVSFTDPLPKKQPLQYTGATNRRLYFKVLGEEFPSYIAELDDTGAERRRIFLEGPFWRYSGLMRPWGDSLLSLSAYQPVIHIIPPDGSLDSLVLKGFDSPMLHRSRAYVLGDVHEPPMLTPSAAAAGDALFVINMRPGWLRIDVFDRNGRLNRRLVQQDPGFSKSYYPIDLDVRKIAASTYEIAIVVVEPEPKLVTYRWTPSSGEQ